MHRITRALLVAAAAIGLAGASIGAAPSPAVRPTSAEAASPSTVLRPLNPIWDVAGLDVP